MGLWPVPSEDFELGTDKANLPSKSSNFPGQSDLHPFFKGSTQIRLIKPNRFNRSGVVGHGGHSEKLSSPRAHVGNLDDPTLNRSLLTKLEIADNPRFGEVLVTEREMIKKISDSGDIQSSEPTRINFSDVGKILNRVVQNHRKIKGKNDDRTKLTEATITTIVQNFRWR